MKNDDGQNLSRKQLVGYGVAGLADNASYGIVSAYLLFFLTSIAHVPNVSAGVINTIGGVWKAIFSPVIGYISDNSNNRYGKRRPFMLASGIILFVSLILIYSNISTSVPLKILFYGALAVVFWTAFAIFVIPYLALGAEITDDYNERTQVRTYTSVFNILGGLFGIAMPTGAVTLLTTKGFTESASWQVAGTVVAVITLGSILYTWNATRWMNEHVIIDQTVRKNVLLNFNTIATMLKEYKQVLSLKPMKYLTLGSVFFLVVNTIWFTVRMYYVTYNLKLSAPVITVLFLFNNGIGLFMVPIIRKLSYIWDKKMAFIVTAIGGMVACIFFGLTGINSIHALIIYFIIIGFTTKAYWQLFPSMNYDICELDQFVYGKTRQGIIVSIQQVAEAFSTAITALLISVILELSGFSGSKAIQTETTENWLLWTYTFLPGLFLVLTIIMVRLYPLDKLKFNLLKKALVEKKSGETPNTSELGKIL